MKEFSYSLDLEQTKLASEALLKMFHDTKNRGEKEIHAALLGMRLSLDVSKYDMEKFMEEYNIKQSAHFCGGEAE